MPTAFTADDLHLHGRVSALDVAPDGQCDARVALSGKSYGGFFSCWTIGHTARFQAAVVMAPVGHIETHYGTSERILGWLSAHVGTDAAAERSAPAPCIPDIGGLPDAERDAANDPSVDTPLQPAQPAHPAQGEAPACA